MAKKQKLTIEIGANVKKAVSGVEKVGKSVNGLVKSTSSVGKKLTGLAGVGGIGALAAGGIKAAGTFEMLELRLEAVTGNAKKAKGIFKEVFDLFVKSPLMLEPLLKSRILLEAIGVKGKKALESVASAALAMGKDVMEVAQAVAALETEPLRRMGIEMTRTGKSAVILFRDKLGKQIRFATNSTEGLRAALLKVFDIKFAGIMKKASETFKGLQSTIQGTIMLIGARIAEPFMPSIKGIMSFIRDEMLKGESQDVFRNFGESLMIALRNAGAKGKNFMQAFQNYWKQEGGLFRVIQDVVVRIIGWVMSKIKAAGKWFVGQAGIVLGHITQLIANQFSFASVKSKVQSGFKMVGSMVKGGVEAAKKAMGTGGLAYFKKGTTKEERIAAAKEWEAIREAQIRKEEIKASSMSFMEHFKTMAGKKGGAGSFFGLGIGRSEQLIFTPTYAGESSVRGSGGLKTKDITKLGPTESMRVRIVQDAMGAYWDAISNKRIRIPGGWNMPGSGMTEKVEGGFLSRMPSHIDPEKFSKLLFLKSEKAAADQERAAENQNNASRNLIKGVNYFVAVMQRGALVG